MRQLGFTLLISTYQAGRLIVVRPSGDTLNTHFRCFHSPMGLAYQRKTGRLAIGTKHEVWRFRDQPDAAARLEPQGLHDAVFLPRQRSYTGDIRIHEIAWIEDELWAVNTRFSCLCTFDSKHSFRPAWRPKFISALAPEDRCHLNGLAVVDGRPKYATCLGETDNPGGWREKKASGGCLLDVETNETILRGLSMPHSPRVYADRQWVLESGIGAFSTFDPATGKTEVVSKLPGFTRGLDFFGNLAFIGLSQVRETAIFSNLPIVDDAPERMCGVWVVNIRTGETVAFLRFEGIVQEIFSVTVLPGLLYPELINEPGDTLDNSFVLPDDALSEVPPAMRSGGGRGD
jgi:uncharacterized protein (TIGR03032 family)